MRLVQCRALLTVLCAAYISRGPHLSAILKLPAETLLFGYSPSPRIITHNLFRVIMTGMLDILCQHSIWQNGLYTSLPHCQLAIEYSSTVKVFRSHLSRVHVYCLPMRSWCHNTMDISSLLNGPPGASGSSNSPQRSSSNSSGSQPSPRTRQPAAAASCPQSPRPAFFEKAPRPPPHRVGKERVLRFCSCGYTNHIRSTHCASCKAILRSQSSGQAGEPTAPTPQASFFLAPAFGSRPTSPPSPSTQFKSCPLQPAIPVLPSMIVPSITTAPVSHRPAHPRKRTSASRTPSSSSKAGRNGSKEISGGLSHDSAAARMQRVMRLCSSCGLSNHIRSARCKSCGAKIENLGRSRAVGKR